MDDRIFVGYTESGEEFFIRNRDFERGIILRGERCTRLVKNMLYELVRKDKKVLAISLARNLSNQISNLLPNADIQSIFGYVFTYSADDQSYHSMLATSISLGLDLGEEYEYMIKDAIKALADAEGAGGVYAILSIMEGQQAKGIETAKRRMQELISFPLSSERQIIHPCIVDLWQIPSPDARVAIALSCASKFSFTSDSYIFLLGWEFINHIEKSAKRKLHHLLSEIAGLSRLIAFQASGEGSSLFGSEITQSGPFYVFKERSETLFAVPELVLNSIPEKLISPKREAKEEAILKILNTIRAYRGSTIAGLMHYLSEEVDEEQFKLAIQESMLRGLIVFADGESGAKALELSDKGREFLRQRGVNA